MKQLEFIGIPPKGRGIHDYFFDFYVLQGGSGFAKGILFEHINFASIGNPIVVDQFLWSQCILQKFGNDLLLLIDLLLLHVNESFELLGRHSRAAIIYDIIRLANW